MGSCKNQALTRFGLMAIVVLGGCASDTGRVPIDDEGFWRMVAAVAVVDPQVDQEYAAASMKRAERAGPMGSFTIAGARWSEGFFMLDCVATLHSPAKGEDLKHSLALFAKDISSDPAGRMRLESARGEVIGCLPLRDDRGRGEDREYMCVLRTPFGFSTKIESTSVGVEMVRVTAVLVTDRPVAVGEQLIATLLGPPDTLAVVAGTRLVGIDMDQQPRQITLR